MQLDAGECGPASAKHVQRSCSLRTVTLAVSCCCGVRHGALQVAGQLRRPSLCRLAALAVRAPRRSLDQAGWGPPRCARRAQDFDSDRLKTKQHWNSFTTAFLLPLSAVRADLLAHGRVAVDRAAADALLKAPLRCNRCGAAQSNMPKLKAHIRACPR